MANCLTEFFTIYRVEYRLRPLFQGDDPTPWMDDTVVDRGPLRDASEECFAQTGMFGFFKLEDAQTRLQEELARGPNRMSDYRIVRSSVTIQHVVVEQHEGTTRTIPNLELANDQDQDPEPN